MVKESTLQTKIVQFLNDNGAYVIKTKPGMGTPVGCPDVFFFYRDRWGCIEVKASPSSPYRPLQHETLVLLARGNEFVWRCDPTTWPQVQQYLERFFF